MNTMPKRDAMYAAVYDALKEIGSSLPIGVELEMEQYTKHDSSYWTIFSPDRPVTDAEKKEMLDYFSKIRDHVRGKLGLDETDESIQVVDNLDEVGPMLEVCDLYLDHE